MNASDMGLYRAKLLAGLIHARAEEQYRKEYLARTDNKNVEMNEFHALQDAWYKALHAMNTASGLTTRLEFGSVKQDGFTPEELKQIDELYAHAEEWHRLEGAQPPAPIQETVMDKLEDIHALYEARMLALLAYAHACKARGHENVKFAPETVRALYSRGAVNLTTSELAQVDAWYKYTRGIFRMVGEPHAPEAQIPEASEAQKDYVVQWEASHINRVCQEKLTELGDIAAQLQRTVHTQLNFYRENHPKYQDRIRRLELDVSDLDNVQAYARQDITRNFCEEDLKHIKATHKQLEELAERLHGLEKLPEEVQGLAQAEDPGYYISSKPDPCGVHE